MQRKRIFLLTLIAGTILGQQWQAPTVKSVTVGVRRDPPLRTPSCKTSTYGYLHINERTKLTSEEISQYIVAAIEDGATVTVYPESKSGIFVDVNCPTKP
jgi:hypothetical protein